MKCPDCEKEDIKSRVYVPMYTVRTLMVSAEYYDEDGKYHSHDNNITSQEYSCSKGHKWIVKSRGSCWCGWPDNENK